MNYFIVINKPMSFADSIALYSRLEPFGANLTELVVRSYVYGDADAATFDIILAEIKRAGFAPVVERRAS